MHRNQKMVSVGGTVVLLCVLMNAVVLQQGFASDAQWYSLLYSTVPLLLISLVHYWRKP